MNWRDKPKRGTFGPRGGDGRAGVGTEGLRRGAGRPLPCARGPAPPAARVSSAPGPGVAEPPLAAPGRGTGAVPVPV